MVEIRRVEELRIALRTAVGMNAVVDLVVNLEEKERIRKVPVPTQPPVGRRAQQAGLLVGEVGLGVDETNRTCWFVLDAASERLSHEKHQRHQSQLGERD